MSSREDLNLSNSSCSDTLQSSSSRMGCCVTFSRIIVFIMNLAMLLVALTVIALALWIRLDDDFEHDLRRDIKFDGDEEPLRDIKNDMRTGITVSFWVIIGFAIACAILGLVGLLGAAAKSRFLLVPYFIGMIFLILLEIAVGIVVLVKRKDVRRTVKDYVYWAYNLNTVDVQTFFYRYNCCGVEGYPNPQCPINAPTCSAAVWDRLDFTLMIFGICMLGVIVLQIICTLISVVIFTYRRKEDGPLMHTHHVEYVLLLCTLSLLAIGEEEEKDVIVLDLSDIDHANGAEIMRNFTEEDPKIIPTMFDFDSLKEAYAKENKEEHFLPSPSRLFFEEKKKK